MGTKVSGVGKAAVRAGPHQRGVATMNLEGLEVVHGRASGSPSCWVGCNDLVAERPFAETAGDDDPEEVVVHLGKRRGVHPGMMGQVDVAAEKWHDRCMQPQT